MKNMKLFLIPLIGTLVWGCKAPLDRKYNPQTIQKDLKDLASENISPDDLTHLKGYTDTSNSVGRQSTYRELINFLRIEREKEKLKKEEEEEIQKYQIAFGWLKFGDARKYVSKELSNKKHFERVQVASGKIRYSPDTLLTSFYIEPEFDSDDRLCGVELEYPYASNEHDYYVGSTNFAWKSAVEYLAKTYGDIPTGKYPELWQFHSGHGYGVDTHWWGKHKTMILLKIIYRQERRSDSVYLIRRWGYYVRLYIFKDRS